MKNRILVIEDNPDNLELMVYLLKQHSYEIITSMDGKEGLAIAKKEIPDLIICDIQLPGLNGYEIVTSLKSDPKLKQIPVIAVTAYSMVGDREKLLKSGFDGYMSKPIEPENFVTDIEKFLNYPPSIRISSIEKTNHASTTQGTILIVDDTFDNRELSRILLETSGFKVLSAESVRQALSIMEKTKPDIILSDLYIPDLNGLDFLKAVRKNLALRSLPFVMTSASSLTSEQQAECSALGVTQIIVRPIEPLLFIKTMQEIWLSIKNSRD